MESKEVKEPKKVGRKKSVKEVKQPKKKPFIFSVKKGNFIISFD